MNYDSKSGMFVAYYWPKIIGLILLMLILAALCSWYIYLNPNVPPEDSEKKAFMESCTKDQPLYLCIDMWRHPQ